MWYSRYVNTFVVLRTVSQQPIISCRIYPPPLPQGFTICDALVLETNCLHPMPRFQTTMSLLYYYVFSASSALQTNAQYIIRKGQAHLLVCALRVWFLYDSMSIMVKAAFRMVHLPRVVIVFLKRVLKKLSSIAFFLKQYVNYYELMTYTLLYITT